MNVVEVADRIVDQAIGYGFAGISANIQNAINDAVAAERRRIMGVIADESMIHSMPSAQRFAEVILTRLHESSV